MLENIESANKNVSIKKHKSIMNIILKPITGSELRVTQDLLLCLKKILIWSVSNGHQNENR